MIFFKLFTYDVIKAWHIPKFSVINKLQPYLQTVNEIVVGNIFMFCSNYTNYNTKIVRYKKENSENVSK